MGDAGKQAVRDAVKDRSGFKLEFEAGECNESLCCWLAFCCLLDCLCYFERMCGRQRPDE
jgi:hypothetical protein